MTTICISHKEDVDGVVAASMLKHLLEADAILADYTNLIPELEKVAMMNDLERLFICDLGLSKANEKRFIEILGGLRGKAEVMYIDHHDLSDGVKRALKKNGVRLVHNIRECTSVLVYDRIGRGRFPRRYALLVACAAIVDNMEHKPMASKLLNMYEKQFVFFEATSLSYAVYSNQHDDEFLRSLVTDLTILMPHEIRGVLDHAKSYADMVTANLEAIEKNAGRKKHLVYVKTGDLSVSIVSNMLLAFHQDRKVALAYKEKNGNVVLSIRGADSVRRHLGRMVNQLSVSLGGAGGGHRRACGAQIPKHRLDEFLERFDSKL